VEKPKVATVLVIDRDMQTLKRTTELLSREGYEVRLWPEEISQLDGFQSGRPSAILLGWQSDGVGTQDLRRLARRFAAIAPIIVLGPDIDVSAKVTLFEMGADDYLVQPFDSSEMLARLRAAIRRFIHS
jgi:DNA-binding response OmpR family regulator